MLTLPPVLDSEAPASKEIDAPSCDPALVPVDTAIFPALPVEESPVFISTDPLACTALPDRNLALPLFTEFEPVDKVKEPLEILELVPD